MKKKIKVEKTPKKTANDWLDMIACASGPEEKVPDGWLSLEEIAKLKNIPLRTAEGMMNRERGAGRVKRVQFRRRCGLKIQLVWHYTATNGDDQ
jgi:hypothetical protein